MRVQSTISTICTLYIHEFLELIVQTSLNNFLKICSNEELIIFKSSNIISFIYTRRSPIKFIMTMTSKPRNFHFRSTKLLMDFNRREKKKFGEVNMHVNCHNINTD